MTSDKVADEVQELLANPDLAGVLESRQFRRFLDKIPIAIAVSELNGGEQIVYANPHFERVLSSRAQPKSKASRGVFCSGRVRIRNSTLARLWPAKATL